ncbi:MAG TPA: MBL fold metallo-hydrolase, partial [Fervidobacterium sp.]|nr:MBL fold metallo-hydrolase [Fervidobacterium sp.]
MRMEILYVGGSIRIPRVIEEAYSTACLLEDGEHKILIDPGTFVSFNLLEEALTKRNIALEDITD